MNEQFNGASAAPEQEIDVEGQIRSGVEAFMQSQDPAIAIEVVTMLAEMMGVAPEIDPYQDQQAAPQQMQAPAAAPQGAPMARNGMRFYAKGGKIGGGTNPEKKKKTAGATTALAPQKVNKTSIFQPQDLNTGSVVNRFTTPELGLSLDENPAKTAKRSRIQAIGAAKGDMSAAGAYPIGNKIGYDANGKIGELAGEMRTLEFEVPGFEHQLPALDIPDMTMEPPVEAASSGILAKPGKTMEEIRQQNGKGPKRRLPRVDYLQGKGHGRNKRTESGY